MPIIPAISHFGFDFLSVKKNAKKAIGKIINPNLWDNMAKFAKIKKYKKCLIFCLKILSWKNTLNTKNKELIKKNCKKLYILICLDQEICQKEKAKNIATRNGKYFFLGNKSFASRKLVKIVAKPKITEKNLRPNSFSPNKITPKEGIRVFSTFPCISPLFKKIDTWLKVNPSSIQRDWKDSL